MQKSNAFWICILGGVLLVAGVAVFLLSQVQTDYARVYKDGVLTETVNLLTATGPSTITITGRTASGDTDGVNVLEVERGRIRMLTADCPDGICVRQGWRSGGLMPIICLPNRVVVVFDGSDNDLDVDAVVG